MPDLTTAPIAAAVFGPAIASGRASELKPWPARWPMRCKNGSRPDSDDTCNAVLHPDGTAEGWTCPACQKSSRMGTYVGTCSLCRGPCRFIRVEDRYFEVCDCRQTPEDRRRAIEAEAREAQRRADREAQREQELVVLALQTDASDCWEAKGRLCYFSRDAAPHRFCPHCPKWRKR